MHFKLSQLQEEIQKAARAFATGEFDKDLALELEKNHEFPKKIWKKAAELGFIGITVPEKYGGQGLGLQENIMVAEEFCRMDSTIGSALMFSGFGSECLLRFACDELKEKFLLKVAEGKMLCGAAFTEPGQGYDIINLNTTAAKDGDEWVINGEKTYVINGGAAGFYCLLCLTNPDSHTPEGISMILVEEDRQGLSAVNSGDKLGLRMTPTSDLHFKDARVPITNLIGKEGKGVKQARAFFDESRILVGALALGMAQGAFDRALGYVKQRKQFGRKIAQFQVTRHKLADMAIKIEQARFMTYWAAWNFDQGKIDAKTTSMSKMVASRTAVEVAYEAIQLLGGYGYMTEYEIERFYRDAKNTEILEGNPAFLKNTIASAVIGKI